MAGSAYDTYHVHGPCYVQVGTGTAQALETLGMTTAGGGRVSFEHFKRNVHTDASGPNVPAVVQNMGHSCRVSLTLQAWSDTIAAKVRKWSRAVPLSGTEGTVGALGAIIGVDPEAGSPTYLFGQSTHGFTFSVALPGEFDDPWYFPTCTITSPEDLKVSTEAGELRVTFFAWPALAGDALTARGSVCHSRTLPA